MKYSKNTGLNRLGQLKIWFYVWYKNHGWGEVGEKKSAPILKVVFKEDAKIR